MSDDRFVANLICIAARLRSLRHFHLRDGYIGDNVMANQLCKDADYLEQQAQRLNEKPHDAGGDCQGAQSVPSVTDSSRPVSPASPPHAVVESCSRLANGDTLLVTAEQRRRAHCGERPEYAHAEPVGQPVAWMYEYDGMCHSADNPPVVTPTRWALCEEPWTETPLYASPSAQPIARDKDREELLTWRAKYRDELWYWQGDGGDYPESLTCPIIMRAEVLREQLRVIQAAAALDKELPKIPDNVQTYHAREQLLELRAALKSAGE